MSTDSNWRTNRNQPKRSDNRTNDPGSTVTQNRWNRGQGGERSQGGQGGERSQGSERSQGGGRQGGRQGGGGRQDNRSNNNGGRQDNRSGGGARRQDIRGGRQDNKGNGGGLIHDLSKPTYESFPSLSASTEKHAEKIPAVISWKDAITKQQEIKTAKLLEQAAVEQVAVEQAVVSTVAKNNESPPVQKYNDSPPNLWVQKTQSNTSTTKRYKDDRSLGPFPVAIKDHPAYIAKRAHENVKPIVIEPVPNKIAMEVKAESDYWDNKYAQSVDEIYDDSEEHIEELED